VALEVQEVRLEMTEHREIRVVPELLAVQDRQEIMEQAVVEIRVQVVQPERPEDLLVII
jgi:hypothetical protein